MNPLRRAFLKNAGAVGSVAIAIAAGLLKPATVFAAAWNSLAFTAKDPADAINNAGYGGATESSDIVLKVPDIAENGAVVPVSATSNIPGTTSMAIFVEKNPTPMIAEFRIFKRRRAVHFHARQDGQDFHRAGDGESGRQELHQQPRSQGYDRRLRRLIRLDRFWNSPYLLI